MKHELVSSLKLIRAFCKFVYSVHGRNVASDEYLRMISDLIIISDGGHVY